jgi:acyl transferase domain-containing protein
MLTATVGLSFAVAGMTSAAGRCHTFDARADGYVRGEACGAAVLQPSPGAAAEAAVLLRGSAVRQDGRSASLTALNGSAQRALLHAALAEAGVAAADLARLEAHGTGTALGDPIEAGALRAALLQPRGEAHAPLAVGSVKANAGHAEPAAAMAGLLVLAAGLARGLAAPNAQLRRLNVRVGEALRGGAARALPTGVAAMMGRREAGGLAGGVSSFGYSGTIAHALLQSASGGNAASAVGGGTAPLRYRSRAFLWSEPAHPLLQRRQPAHSGCAALFRSPVAGPLHALVADHVVRGRIVFPGAAYLETARAACSAVASPSAAGARRCAACSSCSRWRWRRAARRGRREKSIIEEYTSLKPHRV